MNKDIDFNKLKQLIVISIIILFIFGSGVYIGYYRKSEAEKVSTLINIEQEIKTSSDFSVFWKAWNILKNKSIYSDSVTDEDHIWGAISGLASSYNDPYTVFFSPKENESFNEEIKGSFGGIGAEIGIKDKVLTIIAPLKDTPAEKIGLKSGDKIIKIDNVLTNDMTVDQAIEKIHGEKGTSVVITIFRIGEKETREFNIIRDIIEIPTLDSELLPNGIFVIKLYSFSENSDILFKKAIFEFIKTKSNKLIIDLRQNPGGYLDKAVSIASLFIEEGKTIVIEKGNETEESKIYRSNGPKVFNNDLSLVLLVDNGSASASEILAGAIKEYNIGTLIGEKTYGKGSVQELVNLTKDTSLKITVANWYTPNGISISQEGLEPDINISYTIDDYNNKIDPQMAKAIEVLMSK